MLMYDKEIKLSDCLVNGYQYFCDSFHPLAMAGGYVLYHRHVASIKIGRWLLPEEHVHHSDGIKINNDPDNLTVLTNSEHSKLEAELRELKNPSRKCSICERKIKRKNKSGICFSCQRELSVNETKAKHKKNYYSKNKLCSICGNKITNTSVNGMCGDCFNKSRRRFEISKEELEKLVWDIPTREVGKMFGVTDKAIDRRCKLLGISKPPRGYWTKVKYNKL